ncbi:MAG: peroxiredoxin-like family protein [Kofleriaceae bacterium]
MRTATSLSLLGIVISLSAACGGAAPTPTTESTVAEPAAMAAPPAQAAEPAMPALAAPSDDQLGTSPSGLGLKVGARAPNATLPDVSGATVELAQLYAKGPTFIVFYRGGWCPFCNAQLHSLTEAKAEFDKRGVQLVAISVDLPSEEAKTQAQHGVPFPMLSDSKLIVQDAFKIVHKTSAEEQAKLAGYGIDLQAYSGEAHQNFATASIFYVDRDGVIRFAHVDEDYKTRPSTAQLLQIADRLATK